MTTGSPGPELPQPAIGIFGAFGSTPATAEVNGSNLTLNYGGGSQNVIDMRQPNASTLALVASRIAIVTGAEMGGVVLGGVDGSLPSSRLINQTVTIPNPAQSGTLLADLTS